MVVTPVGFSSLEDREFFLDKTVRISIEYTEAPPFTPAPGWDAAVYVNAMVVEPDGLTDRNFCATSAWVRVAYDSMLHETGRRFLVEERFSADGIMESHATSLTAAVERFASAVARRLIDPDHDLCEGHGDFDHDYIESARSCTMKGVL